ncbi:MAG: hypothetical protein WBH85_04790 [Thermoanaerobaculia bacterium]
MPSDWVIALSWMVPGYLSVLGGSFLACHLLTKDWPSLKLVLSWAATPVASWLAALVIIDRWIPLLNLLVEPVILGCFGGGLYLWASFASSMDQRRRRESLGLVILNIAAALTGALFPVLGESL